MRRFIRACLAIFAAICGLAIIVLLVVPQLFGPEDPAVRIALSDPDVKRAIANDQGNYKVVSVTPQGQNGKSGFINISETLVAVELSMQGAMMIAPDHYVAFVDLNQSKVVSGEWYSYRGNPAVFDITLPSGASYYHVLNGGINVGPGSEDFGVQTFWGNIHSLSPENASLYPILVDGSNLSRMKNGSSYEPAAYNDTNTRRPAVMNGSAPVSVGWSVNASVRRTQVYNTGNWPDFDHSQSYYIILKNAGQDTVSMTLMM